MNRGPQWWEQFFARWGGFTFCCTVCGAMVAEPRRELHAGFHGRRQPADQEPTPARKDRIEFPARDGDGKWIRPES